VIVINSHVCLGLQHPSSTASLTSSSSVPTDAQPDCWMPGLRSSASSLLLCSTSLKSRVNAGLQAAVLHALFSRRARGLRVAV
jgi:hypothetical protein